MPTTKSLRACRGIEPPTIGGYNAIAPKPQTETLLKAIHFPPSSAAAAYYVPAYGSHAPLLVVGRHGAGRTAALATDVAPHWVGGFVDWGDRRVTQEVGGGAIEVGNWYAQFFRNLVAWTAKINPKSE